MSHAAVTLEVTNGVAHVQLNRPDRKNAITGTLGNDLAAAVNSAAKDDAVQVLLFTGAGGAFCSGLDLKEFNAEPTPDWVPNFGQIWRGAHNALFNCNKPIVCAMERYAINGGAALAIAADLLVVGENAFLQVGEVQLGMAAPYNMAWLALRHSESLRAQLTLEGRRFNGTELAQMGIAYKCVEDSAVMTEAQALADQLAGYPAGAGEKIKQGLRAELAMDADTFFAQFVPSAPNPVPTVGAKMKS